MKDLLSEALLYEGSSGKLDYSSKRVKGVVGITATAQKNKTKALLQPLLTSPDGFDEVPLYSQIFSVFFYHHILCFVSEDINNN